MRELTVNQGEEGLTVLELLQRRIPAAPPAYLRQLLRGGRVRCEGLPLPGDAVLRAGMRLALPASRRIEDFLATSLDILLETPDLLVAFKPAGLAVHRGSGHEEDNLLLRLQALLKARRAPYMVAPVHRLDAGTSGPVLFGKGRRAVAALGQLFMTDQVEKVYLALVAGEMTGCGTLSSPVPAKGKLKEAQTGYRTVATGNGYALLELRLHSGRTHQIRRQLAAAGHPLAGDRRYGGPLPNGLGRLFLHCRRLAFSDPFDGPLRAVEAPLPEDLAATLRSLGIAPPASGRPPSRS